MKFRMDTSGRWVVSSDLVRLLVVCLFLFLLYFFGTSIMRSVAKYGSKLSKKVGTYSTTKEYALQRYVYQHSESYIARVYGWVNQQLIALGLKRYGVTVFGYMLFWAVICTIATGALTVLLRFGVLFVPPLFLMVYVITLVLTRVMVSERMERREADVMNAVDLIVPEIRGGVKNAIVRYRDNFAPSVRDDFTSFIVNIQDRGYSFEDAMYILSDSLGLVFKDFAQKAIYYEVGGDAGMIDIFTDIVETNRLRRQLRDENNNAFTSLKASFVMSVLLTFGYFIFLMFTDDFSRNFFLQETTGKVLLLVIIGVVFSVLAYISTLKSRAI